MRLRELINRLEKLTENGKYDNLDVVVENPNDPWQNICLSNAFRDRIIESDYECDYILLTAFDREENDTNKCRECGGDVTKQTSECGNYTMEVCEKCGLVGDIRKIHK